MGLATLEEVRASLPGDGIVPEPQRISTRAVTIDAAPDAVWPWLAQIGHARGGLCSYDWPESLVGCDLHSADQVLVEHQTLHRGDLIRMGPEGYPTFEGAEQTAMWAVVQPIAFAMERKMLLGIRDRAERSG